ncbi:MAG: hypothetical protein OXF27_02710 [Acidobacteria bacterium]|nr:hypothetical protein [Acidobacteriota bacterium]
MTRFHDLDALRGFAMLLGILLHAGLFLVPLEERPVHEAWAWETPPETNGPRSLQGRAHVLVEAGVVDPTPQQIRTCGFRRTRLL